MIIIAIVISIVFILILGMIIKAYFDDIIELNDRIQVLEKRDAEKLTKKDFNDTIDFLMDSCQQQDLLIQELNRRIEKLEKTNKKNKRDISKNN